MSLPRQIVGVPVGKVLKRLLKRPLLWLLKQLTDEVEENWRQGQGPGGR